MSTDIIVNAAELISGLMKTGTESTVTTHCDMAILQESGTNKTRYCKTYFITMVDTSVNFAFKKK